MSAFKPVHTLKSTVFILFTVGALLILVGAILYWNATDVIYYEQRYDNEEGCDQIPGLCEITIDIDDTMKEPVFLYYKMVNFY